MKLLLRHRREAVWVLLLLAVAAAALLPAAGGSRVDTDTWGTGSPGKKALFTLARELLPDVRRGTGRLEPPPEAGTLCILGPARYPDAAEWRLLHAWVLSGHTLVVAAREDELVADLPPFGLRVRPGSPREGAAAGGGRSVEVDEALVGARLDGLTWRSPAVVEGARPGAWIPVKHDGRPVAVFQKEGRGLLVVVASDQIFENLSLLQPDRALLAFRLLEQARAEGALIFDETLNAGGPRIVGLLLDRTFRPLTLQLLGVAVLFGWMGARPFGPRSAGEPVSRRHMPEHAVALAHLYHRASAGGSLVASYLDYFRRELGLAHGARAGRELEEALARRARVNGRAVQGALRQATEAATVQGTSNDQAASAIAELARLKHRIEHPH